MTVRLAPVLPTSVAVVQFPDVQKATQAVIEALNAGVGIRESLEPRISKAQDHDMDRKNVSNWSTTNS